MISYSICLSLSDFIQCESLGPSLMLQMALFHSFWWLSNGKSREAKFPGSWSEKAVAPYSSTLAWKIPWMEEPGRLQSMGSPRVGYDWATWLSLFTFMHWRRKWQPTPVFLPGESQGPGSLVACGLWDRTESDTTEATEQLMRLSSIFTLESSFFFFFLHIVKLQYELME